MNHWPPVPPLPEEIKPFVVVAAPPASAEAVEVHRIPLAMGDTLDDVIGRIKFVGPPAIYTVPDAGGKVPWPFIRLEPRELIPPKFDGPSPLIRAMQELAVLDAIYRANYQAQGLPYPVDSLHVRGGTGGIPTSAVSAPSQDTDAPHVVEGK